MGKLVKITFFFLIGILLIWWSLQQIPPAEWGKFKLSLAHSRFWIIVPVFLLLAFSHLLRALRWRLLMEPLGYQPSIMNTYLAVLIGYLANLAIPRLGEVLKCTLLSKYEKVPADKIVGTIVAERAFDVFCLGLVFLLALTLQFNVIESGWHQLNTASLGRNANPNHLKPLILIVTGVFTALIILFFLFRQKLTKLIESLKNIFWGVWSGMMSATKLKKLNLSRF